MTLMLNAGRTGQQHAEEWNWTTFLHHTQKINSKRVKDLNVRQETNKILVETSLTSSGTTFY